MHCLGWKYNDLYGKLGGKYTSHMDPMGVLRDFPLIVPCLGW